jgi:hypothetical protein
MKSLQFSEPMEQESDSLRISEKRKTRCPGAPRLAPCQLLIRPAQCEPQYSAASESSNTVEIFTANSAENDIWTMQNLIDVMSDEEFFSLPFEIQQAVANQRLEGLELSREVILDSLRQIHGEVSTEELIRKYKTR